ncbi:EstA family serine hydrolase [Conexibacter woesei]|uniref:Beta-lactamase n=1 Tax=Conexibacter woesei (strain DSM 14684 / CCUG 47730 / CIP 108061 / JCM 11494 / NBRC 100937 / ID131577) TaxID=469383 RepID=D3FAQ9_CONWI|nr:EstA family serine hydrolase [Conexibacter woesei]ADB51222.1 beta-lactamase [Conexibacter woesei DSM 14684]
MTDIVQGHCEDRFAHVREAFEEGLRGQALGGGAVSVWLDGEPVVELWGGSPTIAEPTPWREDTLSPIQSATKGLAAICVHVMVDRGTIELDRPVADYWPEFAAAGKAAITVRTLLGGLAALVYADAAPPETLFEHEPMARALEQQAPAWEPGTQGAYHSSTFGPLLDELVRRADGRSVAKVFADEVAAPLGLDAHLGVAAADLDRIAETHMPPNPVMAAIFSGDGRLSRAWRPVPHDPEFFSRDAFKQSGNATGGGYVTASALAQLYGTLATGGGPILSPAAVDTLREQQWAGVCGLTDRPMRMALGLSLDDATHPMGGPNGFGHYGLGGSLGAADPDAGLGFGYTTNSLDGDGRCRALVDAVRGSLR